ncbi:AAA family ATPase [Sulfidibacter corallicola]|uniref:AAA family ATPase n=1 Tax=Sulfidibacter corallicola TaxID=2818388 RepID=A0A8A4TSQ2_SULCO|nr:AAA family ATPase [Sulfidibacter corallicola]QTD52417.1 AAA family ATPase [Sulfidibacter corallicola]
MFDPRVLTALRQAGDQAFRQLTLVEDELNRRFADSEDAVSALMLAVASGEPLLLIGPPGTGKSRLIRAFCGLTGLLDETDPARDHPDYFEYLLTPFTEPSELFGFYDIPRAMKGELVRIDSGMMQHAIVVYLDEVFNGSSAILNSILAFLNERVFHDRGMRHPVRLECLLAATNQIPEAPELRAVFDRFTLRCQLRNIEARPESLGTLLRKGWTETYSRHRALPDCADLFARVANFRGVMTRMTSEGLLVPESNHPFYRSLAQMVQQARQYDLSEMSNRRLVKMVHIMVMHRLYRATRAEEPLDAALSLGSEQLTLIPRYFLDLEDEEIAYKLERVAARA